MKIALSLNILQTYKPELELKSSFSQARVIIKKPKSLKDIIDWSFYGPSSSFSSPFNFSSFFSSMISIIYLFINLLTLKLANICYVPAIE